MNIEPGDLLVGGVGVAQYAVASFAYDPNTFTATWTLQAPVAADKLSFLVAAGAVTDTAGTALAAFTRRVDVLPGDVNRDGVVNASDLVLVRNRVGKGTTNPGSPTATPPNDYGPFYDVNGDGVINASDIVLTRNSVGKALPAGSPMAAAPAALFADRRVSASGPDDELRRLLA